MMLMSIFFSCKTFQKIEHHPSFNLPQTLGKDSDTLSIGDVSVNVFYSDQLLRSLIDSTLRNNLDLQVALQNIEIAATYYRQAHGLLRPSVTGIASVNVDKFGRYTLEGKNNRGTNLNSEFFLGLQSSWEIDIWKRLRNSRKAEYHRLLASESGMQLVRTMLVAEVANKYYDLVAQDMQLEIIRRNIKLRESALEIITIQKEVGTITQLAVEQFRAQLLNSKSLEAATVREIYAIENELNLLAGRRPQPIPRADSLPPVPQVEHIRAGLTHKMIQRRPDIREGQLLLQAAKLDVEVAQADFLPKLVISPFLALNPFNIINILNPAATAFGVASGLTAPIFNRIQLQSQYDRASRHTQNAMINYNKLVLSSFYEIRTVMNDLEQLHQLVAFKKEEARVLKNAADISNDLYLAGYATYLEVIIAQRNVVDVELEAVNTRNDLVKSYTNLYRSLGGGWR